jgi:hypothetical protein
VDVLCKIDPNYKKLVTPNKKGGKQLLLLCENAIYGTLIVSLLFYNTFVKTLKQNGFKLNPYKPCLVNRMVTGSNRLVACMLMTAFAQVREQQMLGSLKHVKKSMKVCSRMVPAS